METKLYIGTAAWNIPKELKSNFSALGSQLQQYSRRLNAVEINTSFYKDHKAITYERWRETTPEHFRFSVKLSKIFTHTQRMALGPVDLKTNLSAIMQLKEKLGVLLVQLPPSKEFNLVLARNFFNELREHYQGAIAFEPRHVSWNSPAAKEIFNSFLLSRVIADPAPIGVDDSLSAAGDIIYYRLHGSPIIYKSNYQLARLQLYARELQANLKRHRKSAWCIFENTTYGYATSNALTLTEYVKPVAEERSLHA